MQSIRDFLKILTDKKQLKSIDLEVDSYLEVTEISQRTLNRKGPALLFNNIKSNNIKMLTNLFGHPERTAIALGKNKVEDLREIGELLAFLKEPEPPKGFKDTIDKAKIFKQALNMGIKNIKNPVCQQIVKTGNDVDLTMLPIQHCWPKDVAPLITWGLTITKKQSRQNIGIYRQQLIGKNKLIMRWLAHRGGALDFEQFKKDNPNEKFPVVVAIGADPATTLAAVTPVPDTMSEYNFAGLLRGQKTELAKALSCDIQIPANSEIILEGYIDPEETAPEGPFGDHTGYYNEVAQFPVFTVTHMTHRENPIYHSTHTGRPPDEPAMLGVALNEIFVPIIKKQFSEIVDFYLPPEGCSYRMAVISINKMYAGQARRVMMGVWSFLKQFLYTKFIIIVDNDINCREWNDVIWAITTRVDPIRDTMLIDNTPIDYLDFASPLSGLGSKIGIDATNKIQNETIREWGEAISMKESVKSKVDQIWSELGL